MSIFKRWVTGAIMSAVILSAMPTPVGASSSVRIVDDDGTASVASCASPTPTFRRIQPAIDASGPGDTVLICPGTYTEVLTIEGPRDGIALRAATAKRPRIRPPRTFEGAIKESIRGVVTAAHVERVVLDGLRVTPWGGAGTCRGLLRLVVSDNASLTIRNSRFVGVRPFGGTCGRYGQALFQTGPYKGPPPRVAVHDSVIRDFGNLGIFIFAPPAVLVVSRTRFVQRHRDGGGAIHSGGGTIRVRDSSFRAHSSVEPMSYVLAASGPARDLRVRRNTMDRVAQGLVIGRTSAGLIEDNVAVGSAANGSGGPTAGGSGIFLHPEASSVVVETNRFTGFARSGIEVAGAGNTMVGNDFRGNSGIDCVDTAAPGDNAWMRNLGHESTPAGICRGP